MHPDPKIVATLAPRLANLVSRKEKTREVASFLFFTLGIYPSAGVVLKYSGHGSLTDINADLRQFWSDLREAGRAKISAPPLPDAITAKIEGALEEIWNLARSEADSHLAEERLELSHRSAVMEREVEMAVHDRTAAAEALQQAREDLRGVQAQLNEASATAEGLASANAALESQLTDWRQRASDEASARAAAERTYQESLAAERAANQRHIEVLEGQVRFSTLQIDAARQELKSLQSEYKRLSGIQELELSHMRRRASDAEDLAASLKMQISELKGELIKSNAVGDAVQIGGPMGRGKGRVFKRRR